MEKVEIKHFKVQQLPISAEKNSIYYVLDSERNRVKTYITDNIGIPIPLIDLKGEGIVESVTGTAVTGTITNPEINIVNLLSSELGNLVKLSSVDGKLKVNRITSPDLSLEVVNSENELQLQIASGLIEKINNALQPEDITQYTDEGAQDAVGNILVDSNTIDLVYNDNIPQISASVKQNSITNNELSSSVNNSLNLANTSLQPVAIQNFFNKIVDDTDDIVEGTIKKFTTISEKNFWNNKQPLLVSGTNIKTINGNSLLGSGNVEVITDISGKEDIANKQNSLAVDGTGNKFPTVDAVNTLRDYTKEISVGVGGTYSTLELLFANEPAGKTLIKLTDSNYTSTNPQFVVKTGWILQGQGYGKTNLTFNFTTAIDPNLSGLQIRTDCELVDFKVTSINNTDLGGFSQYALHSDYTGAFTAKITRCWFKTVANPNVVDANGYNGLAVGIGTWEGQVLEFHESILQGQSVSIDNKYTLNLHNTFLSTVHSTPSRVSFYNSQLTGGFTTVLISDTYSNSTESDSARIKDLFEFVGCEIKGGIYLRTANQLGGADRKNGLDFNFSGTNIDEFINVGEIVNTSLTNYDVTSLPLTKDVDFKKNVGDSAINEGDFVSYVYANRIPEYHRPEAIMTPIGIEKLDSTNVKYFAGISLTDSFVGDFAHIAKGAIAYTKDAFVDIEIGAKLAFNDGGVLVKSSISGIGTVIKKTTDNRLGILLMPSGRKENTIGDYTDRGLLQIRGNSGGAGQPSIFLEDKNIYGGFTNYAISAGSNSNRLFPETVEEGRFSINDNLAGRERLGIDIAGDVYIDRRLINYSINNVNSPILGIHSGNASFLSQDGLNGLNFGASQSSGNGWIQVHENIGGVGIAHDLLLQPSGGNVLIGGSVSASTYTGSATLTGTPTAPTATAGTNTAQIANTLFVNSAISVAKPYKVYTALLSQSGTNAPVATVLENTLGGTVVWTRNTTGVFYGTLSGALFTGNKTVKFGTLGFTSSLNSTIEIESTNTNIVALITKVNGTQTDGVMSNGGTSIEIRVYN